MFRLLHTDPQIELKPLSIVVRSTHIQSCTYSTTCALPHNMRIYSKIFCITIATISYVLLYSSLVLMRFQACLHSRAKLNQREKGRMHSTYMYMHFQLLNNCSCTCILYFISPPCKARFRLYKCTTL